MHGCYDIWLGKSATLTTSAVTYIPKNQLIHPMKTIQNNSTSSPDSAPPNKYTIFYMEKEIQAEEVRRGKQR